eukprot:3787672-Rhodomonas_salina.1
MARAGVWEEPCPAGSGKLGPIEVTLAAIGPDVGSRSSLCRGCGCGQGHAGPKVVEEGRERGVGELSKLLCGELGCDGRWGGGDGSPDVEEGGGVESKGCGVVVAEESTFVGVGYRAAWARACDSGLGGGGTFPPSASCWVGLEGRGEAVVGDEDGLACDHGRAELAWRDGGPAGAEVAVGGDGGCVHVGEGVEVEDGGDGVHHAIPPAYWLCHVNKYCRL